jgi:hypothetical protein
VPSADDPFEKMVLPVNWAPVRHEPGKATVLGVQDTGLRVELCLDLYERGLGETLVLYDPEAGERPTRAEVDEAFAHYPLSASLIEVPSPRDYRGARAFMLRDEEGNLPMDVSAPPEQVELMDALLARMERSIEKQFARRARDGKLASELAIFIEQRLDGNERAVVSERASIAMILRGLGLDPAIAHRIEEPCEAGVHAVFIVWRGARTADVGYQAVHRDRRRIH